MNLHEAMQGDIDRIFLNLDEFACVHKFGGREVVCIVDDNEVMAQGGVGSSFANESAIGLLQCDRVVYCRAGALSPFPLAGESVEMDGRIWLVGDGVNETEGLATIPLNRKF